MPNILLPTFDAPVKHPAKYSPDLLRVMARYLQRGWLVYDPFGGVGGLHRISSTTGAKTFCGEIEYRVIANARGTRSITANAMALPFGDSTFDAIATSPTYGNRMADDTSKWVGDWTWNTYRFQFGFDLHPDNAGGMNWGNAYRTLHVSAWAEAYRVLKAGGTFILNVSDHIRAKQRVFVSQWHLETLGALGFVLDETIEVKTPRLTMGKNRERVPFESVFVLRKP